MTTNETDRSCRRAGNRSAPDVILVGCVKTKRSGRSAAKDLYDSPLWRARRAYAEQFCVPWHILSAKYGLLAPETVIRTYDVTLTDRSAAERRTWSQRVLDFLADELPDPEGANIEIHAGKAYVDYGLEAGLCRMGAKVHRPLQHIPGIGAQIAWYKQRFQRA